MAEIGTSTATITVAGRELEGAATNRACVLYADELSGRLDEPYAGHLIHDVLAERQAVMADESNRFPEWSQLPRLIDAIWAMARAAGSIKETRKAFVRHVMDGTANLYEPAQATNVVFGDFGERTFFRLPAGLEHLAESDDGRQGDE